jgi:type II restriction enzyme
MEESTRKTIHSLLKNFAQKSFKDYDVEKLKKAYPFHRLFFDELGLIAFKQERSVVTKMGMHLYPELARTIALEHYKDVVREKAIRGFATASTASAIDRIVTELRINQRSPNQANEILEIQNTINTDERTIELRITADIYIGDYPGGPFFAEIKSPLPNLDVCAETKKKILTFNTLLHDQNPKGYLAFPYNPFITRSLYKHAFTNRIMDMGNDILMAEEFWDFIGGQGTFDILLSIIELVGEEIRKEKSALISNPNTLF